MATDFVLTVARFDDDGELSKNARLLEESFATKSTVTLLLDGVKHTGYTIRMWPDELRLGKPIECRAVFRTTAQRPPPVSQVIARAYGSKPPNSPT